MTPHMLVTPAQVAVAKLHVELANELGEPVENAIQAIAHAGEASVNVDVSTTADGVVTPDDETFDRSLDAQRRLGDRGAGGVDANLLPAPGTHTGRTPEEAAQARFEIYKDARGEFRFRLKASNGEIVATSEGYVTKDGAKEGLVAIKRAAAETAIVEA